MRSDGAVSLCILLYVSGLLVACHARATPIVPPEDYFSCFLLPETSTYVLAPGRNESAMAYGFFRDTVETTGSSFLFVHTNGRFTDRQQMSCAGYLEGFLSAHRIKDFYRSVREGAFPNEILHAKIHQWLERSLDWTLKNVAENDGRKVKDKYWTVVGNTMVQLLGLVEGYNANSDLQLTASDLFLMNSLGDLDDLLPAVNDTLHRTNTTLKTTSESPRYCSEPWCIADAEFRSHCSVIVKVIQGELYATHNMWTAYFQMLVTWKQFDFALSDAGIVSSKVAFSSWPGMLSSEDDFYITGSGLMIVETTNNVYNLALYDSISPASLVAWVRATTANYLATDGLSWHELFKQHNSGTYNNQWVVTDTKLYSPGSTVLAPNTIIVGSQLPNYYEYADVTGFYNQHGYWASYNVPYFKTAFQLSGYDRMEQLYGDLFSWEKTPRAKIFRERQGNVTDLPSLKHLMRYNNWTHDPLSLGCPMNQLAARGDLSPAGNPMCLRGAFGAVNAKITSSARVSRFQADLIVGPTHEDLPIFSWTPEFETKFPMPHYGQAHTYNFDWQLVQHPLL